MPISESAGVAGGLPCFIAGLMFGSKLLEAMKFKSNITEKEKALWNNAHKALIALQDNSIV